jgi:hypothetical protein
VTTAELKFRVPTAADAAEACRWLVPAQRPLDLLERANNYYAIIDGADQLVGVCCFGARAQVGGGDYQAQAIDVAAHWPEHLTPEASEIVLAVALFSKALFHVAPLRATTSVAQTLIRAWEAAGFLPIQRFTGSDGGDYLQLAMPPSNLG